ncbi:MAG: hypothetical protein JWQ96_3413 [Segetibacter sp.]|nr:hypothetical protein [Segetibacter sp.]
METIELKTSIKCSSLHCMSYFQLLNEVIGKEIGKCIPKLEVSAYGYYRSFDKSEMIEAVQKVKN